MTQKPKSAIGGTIADRSAHPAVRKVKRFYKSVAAQPLGDGFGIFADGRPILTPNRLVLKLPNRSLANAIAAEWVMQRATMDPSTMRLTKIANTAIDGVASSIDAVRDEIVAHAGTDLVCYRAPGPGRLVQLQGKHWDPVLRWAEVEFRCPWVVSQGVLPVRQSSDVLHAIRSALDVLCPFRLAALHVMTTLTASALLGLACLRGAKTVDEVWVAAHVDEDWQIAQWGDDDEARWRRAARWHDMQTADRLIRFMAAD